MSVRDLALVVVVAALLALPVAGCGDRKHGIVATDGGLDTETVIDAVDARVEVAAAEVAADAEDASSDIAPDTSGCACDRQCRGLTTDPCQRGRCLLGACVVEALSCDDDDACTVDHCQAGVGCVHEPLGLSCDDGNACTTDSCDRLTGECAFRPNAKTCDDGDACTRGDRCEAGACVGTEPVTCPCRATAACDPSTGVCLGAPVADGTACDDGDVCTGGDSCVAGECVGSGPGAPRLELIGSATPRGREPIGEIALGQGAAAGLLYAAAGFGVEVYDVSDPEAPTPVADVPTPGVATGIKVVGDRAYVADGENGLRVVDLSEPLAPKLMGAVATDGFARRLDVKGSLVYVAVEDVGLRIVDVTEPEDPFVVGGVDTGCILDCGRDVAVSGSLAYLADGWYRLTIVDVSDAATPVVVSAVESPADLEALDVVGGVAYAASVGPLGKEGMRALDVTDASNVSEIGNVELNLRASVDVLVANDVAYLPTADALFTIDVCDPRQPGVLGSLWTNESWHQSIAISGQRAYLAAGSSSLGVTVVDITDPAAPASMGSFEPPGQAHGLWVAGDLAYIADGYAGLRILDVGDPASPVELSRLPEVAFANSVQVVGSIAYVAALWSGVFTVDVSDPHAPAILGSYESGVGPLGAQIWEVQVVGGVGYMALTSGNLSYIGLGVLDVSDPSALKPIGLFNDWPVDAVDVHDGVAFVASSGYADLGVVDVTVPTEPKPIATVELPVTPDDEYRVSNDIRVVADLAYVAYQASFAAMQGGLAIYDVADPTMPVLLGLVDTVGRARRIEIVGDYAYLGEDSRGVHVIDVRDPTHPVNVGSFDTPGNAWTVQVVGDLVYVADGPGLFQVFKNACPAGP